MNKTIGITVGLLSLLFGCRQGTPYEYKNGVWYYDDHAITTKEPGFKALNKRFAKSDTAVYYRDGRITAADPKTFVPIDEHYAKDKLRAYYCDTYRKGQEYYMIKHNNVINLDNVDTDIFNILPYGYATDRKKVFYEGKIFDVKDAASFEVVNYTFARDKKVGYYNQSIIEGSNGESFKALDDHYATDTNHVFFCEMLPRDANEMPKPSSKIVKDARMQGFRLFEFGYATDDHLVFYNGEPVKGADPKTFTMIDTTTDSADAKDAASTFYRGKKIK